MGQKRLVDVWSGRQARDDSLVKRRRPNHEPLFFFWSSSCLSPPCQDIEAVKTTKSQVAIDG